MTELEEGDQGNGYPLPPSPTEQTESALEWIAAAASCWIRGEYIGAMASSESYSGDSGRPSSSTPPPDEPPPSLWRWLLNRLWGAVPKRPREEQRRRAEDVEGQPAEKRRRIYLEEEASNEGLPRNYFPVKQEADDVPSGEEEEGAGRRRPKLLLVGGDAVQRHDGQRQEHRIVANSSPAKENKLRRSFGGHLEEGRRRGEGSNPLDRSTWSSVDVDAVGGVEAEAGLVRERDQNSPGKSEGAGEITPETAGCGEAEDIDFGRSLDGEEDNDERMDDASAAGLAAVDVLLADVPSASVSPEADAGGAASAGEGTPGEVVVSGAVGGESNSKPEERRNADEEFEAECLQNIEQSEARLVRLGLLPEHPERSDHSDGGSSETASPPSLSAGTIAAATVPARRLDRLCLDEGGRVNVGGGANPSSTQQIRTCDRCEDEPLLAAAAATKKRGWGAQNGTVHAERGGSIVWGSPSSYDIAAQAAVATATVDDDAISLAVRAANAATEGYILQFGDAARAVDVHAEQEQQRGSVVVDSSDVITSALHAIAGPSFVVDVNAIASAVHAANASTEKKATAEIQHCMGPANGCPSNMLYDKYLQCVIREQAASGAVAYPSDAQPSSPGERPEKKKASPTAAKKKATKKREAKKKREATKKREEDQQIADILEDPEKGELLRNAAALWDSATNAHQSTEWKEAVAQCFDAGIERTPLALFTLKNSDSEISGDLPLWKQPVFVKIDQGLRRNFNKPFCKIAKRADRKPLEEAERGVVEEKLRRRLGLNDKGEVSNPVPFSTYNAEKGEAVAIHGVPTKHLGKLLQTDFDDTSGMMEADEQPTLREQVTFSIPKRQADLIIAEADSMESLQERLRELHAEQTQQSPTQMESYFYFKGVTYYVWADMPIALVEELKRLGLLEQFKQAVEEILLLVNVVKIGHSMEDLWRHLKKMKGLLTFRAGLTLCYAAIGIPFGFCQSVIVEGSEHFHQVGFRVNGELHDRTCQIDAPIRRIVKRTGGKVIARGIVRPDVELNVQPFRNCEKDGEGWLYAWLYGWSKEQLELFWRVYNTMKEKGEESACAFILALVAVKIGATSKEDPEARIGVAHWAWAGSLHYWAAKGYSKVFEEEKRRHKEFADFHLSGERFNLLQADDETKTFCETDEFQAFKQEHDDDERFSVESKNNFERRRNRTHFYARQAQQWISLGLVTLDEIVKQAMAGAIVVSASNAQPRISAQVVKDFVWNDASLAVPYEHLSVTAAESNPISNSKKDPKLSKLRGIVVMVADEEYLIETKLISLDVLRKVGIKYGIPRARSLKKKEIADALVGYRARRERHAATGIEETRP